ncbi:hypothetical protein Taro_021974, partial [Colocasia esculenta]|nr:hypothetical protein [Colocasia esculenta]
MTTLNRKKLLPGPCLDTAPGRAQGLTLHRALPLSQALPFGLSVVLFFGLSPSLFAGATPLCIVFSPLHMRSPPSLVLAVSSFPPSPPSGSQRKNAPDTLIYLFRSQALLIASSGAKFVGRWKNETAVAQLDTSTNQYCKFDSQLLTSFTSLLYLAALVASFFASAVSGMFGRKCLMLFGGVTFLARAAINGTAKDVAMLIIGRIFLGVGVGFANQSVRVHLSEMAPARYRGMLNIGFQLMIASGIFATNLSNYGTDIIGAGWGWHVSLAGAAVPAAIITLGSMFLPDNPNSIIDHLISMFLPATLNSIINRLRSTFLPNTLNSIIDRLREAAARDMLRRVQELVVASNQSRPMQRPRANIIQRKYRPQLTMAILIPFFQQLTDVNVIMLYAPVLFKTIGFGDNASLMSAVIAGLVNVFSTLVSACYTGRASRLKLFFEGGTQMLVCQ